MRTRLIGGALGAAILQSRIFIIIFMGGNVMANEAMMGTGQQGAFKASAMTNPVIKKLGKVTEQATDGRVATYGGIGAKTIFFLILTGVGIGAFFILHSMFGGGDGIPITIGDGTEVTIAFKEMPIILAAVLLTVITPLIAWLIRPAIPLFGSLYSLSQGYVIAFMAFVYNGQYDMYMWLALLITMAIVLVMLFLYMKRIIRVTAKFNAVIRVLFFTTVLSGLGAFVLSFIPATKGLITALSGNPILSIGGSILFIIVAALFLLSDFDAVEKTVEHQLPKKYEWAAAYGLVFTVIWLYFKVLNLLMQINSKR